MSNRARHPVSPKRASVRLLGHALSVGALLLVVEKELSAQVGAVVVPTGFATVEGNKWMTTHFAERRARRVQVLIGAEHLRGLAGKRLSKLAFRKDITDTQDYLSLRGTESTHVRVFASWSDASPAAPATDFAGNHGPVVKEVHAATIQLPLVTGGSKETRNVATFGAHEAPTLVFKTTLMHQPNKTLVLEFLTVGAALGHVWEWPIDSVSSPKRGRQRAIGTSCWPSKKEPSAKVMLASLRPGMHIKTTSWAPREPVAAFLMIGMSDKLAWGSVTLPITIAPPSCKLFVSPDILVPALFHAGASALIGGDTAHAIATPPDPRLAGSQLYLQYLFLVMENSKAKIQTSNGIEASFATAAATLGMSVVATGDTTSKSGRVFLDVGPVMQITGR